MSVWNVEYDGIDFQKVFLFRTSSSTSCVSTLMFIFHLYILFRIILFWNYINKLNAMIMRSCAQTNFRGCHAENTSYHLDGWYTDFCKSIEFFFTTNEYKFDNRIDRYQYLTDRSENRIWCSWLLVLYCISFSSMKLTMVFKDDCVI